MEKYFKRLKVGARAKMANKTKSARSSNRVEYQKFRLVVFIIACVVLSTYIIVSKPQIDPFLTSKFFFSIHRSFFYEYFRNCDLYLPLVALVGFIGFQLLNCCKCLGVLFALLRYIGEFKAIKAYRSE